MKNSRFTKTLIGVIAALAIIGGATAGVAAGHDKPHFHRNSSGSTYGSISGIADYRDWPDLIAVMSSSGTVGYVKSADFAEATSANEVVSSPAEALDVMKTRGASGSGSALPMFDSEGVLIGEWDGINWTGRNLTSEELSNPNSH